MKNRCAWAEAGDGLNRQYHDTEWGVPVHNDAVHFEFLILEGAQAGLSWATILKRREGYREAFDRFNPKKMARYDGEKIEQLMHNPKIIRNRLKIEGAIINAQKFLEIQKEFGSFDAYVWRFVGGKPVRNHWKSIKEIPAQSKEAAELSKDLKKRGFKFVGPTIIYAHMQATGLVNDHTVDCFRYKQVYK